MGKKYCCIPWCHNTSDTVLPDGTKIILHRFPMSEKKTHIRRLWISKIKNVRANLNVKDHSRICSAHFEGIFTDISIPTIFPSKPIKEVKTRRPLIRHAIEVQKIGDYNNNCDEKTCVDKIADEKLDDTCSHDNSEQVLRTHKIVEKSDAETLCKPTVSDAESQVENCDFERKDVGIQCDLPRFTYEDVKDDDSKVRFYTGFVSFKVFWLFFRTLVSHGAEKLNYWEGERRSMGGKGYQQQGYLKPGKQRFLRPIDEFLMCCMRLRLNLNQEHLSDIFRVSNTTVSRIMNTWINFMYDHCKALIKWPTRTQILQNLPQLFFDHPDTRIVLDCTEFFTERPSSLVSQWLTWSEYKHHNTFKVLIGVAPNGMATFVSRLWGGNVSDRHIVQHDDLIPKLSAGDVVMADKGFTIEDLLPPDVGLNVPPRVSTKHQMSSSDFFNTANIASARIVVEMKMEQIKNFQILNSVLPLSEAPLSEQIIVLCVALTNLLPPLLK